MITGKEGWCLSWQIFVMGSKIFFSRVWVHWPMVERANELVNNLIEKGELTVEQGKELNTELKHKANDAFGQMRDEALAAQLQAMTPEQRADFVAKVNELANKVTDDAAAAVKDAAE